MPIDRMKLQALTVTDSNSSIDDEDTYLHIARAKVLNDDKAALKKLIVGDPRLLNASDNLGRCLLHYAASSNKLRIVKFLLKRGSNINSKDSLSRTPLHWAVHWGHTELVKKLLNYSPDINIFDSDGQTALHLSVKQKSVKCFKILIEFVEKHLQSSSYCFLDTNGRSLLHCAAACGHVDHLLILLKSSLNVDVDQRDYEGKTALMLAASSPSDGSLTCCKLLIHQSPFVLKISDKTDSSALHEAARANNATVVDFLLASNFCGVDDSNNDGHTALHVACIFGAVDAVEALLRRNASVTATDRRHSTPLHYAASLSGAVGTQIVRRLLITPSVGSDSGIVKKDHVALSDCRSSKRDKNGANVQHLICSADGSTETCELNFTGMAAASMMDADGRTPLACAVALGLDDTIRLLFDLTNGDKYQKDYNGYSLLHIAAQAGHCHTLQMLIKHDLPLESLDVYGLSPLLTAVESGQTRCVQILLKAGADPARCDRHGRTALHWAALGGHAFLCQLLVKQGLNPDFADPCGRIPLHCAAFSGNTDCVSVLLSACPQTIYATDNDSYSPLHLAVEQGNLSVVKLLIESDESCAINAVCRSDGGRARTPLDLALDRQRRAFRRTATPTDVAKTSDCDFSAKSGGGDDVMSELEKCDVIGELEKCDVIGDVSGIRAIGVDNDVRRRRLFDAAQRKDNDVETDDDVGGVSDDVALVVYLRSLGALTFEALSVAAATKIQAFYRSCRVRKSVAKMRNGRRCCS